MRLKELNVTEKRGGPGYVKVGLLYPSTYPASLASLAYQMMYYYINSLEGYVAERFVLEIEGGARSIERNSRLSAMDAVLVSVHYELDYPNIVRALRNAGIEPRRRFRKCRPVVFAGGPSLISNPAPLSEIADVIIVGEVEPTIPAILDSLLSEGCRPVDTLAGKDGFYVYGQERAMRVYAKTLDASFHPVAQIQPLDKEPLWGRSTMIEAMRGCYRGCRFCLEGHVFLPKRDRPLAQIRKIAEDGLAANNTRKVVFYSLSFFDHKESDKILETMLELGVEASVPSLRIDSLNERRLELISALGQRTLTMAPESASCPLKRAINKVVSFEQLLRVSKSASRHGFKKLKLYYMVGLPGESKRDVERIAEEVALVKKEFGGPVSVSVNPFMPKPATPMQWMGLDDRSSLKHKVRMLTRRLRASGIDVDFYDPRLAEIQTAISRGGSEIGCLLLYVSGGASWNEAFRRCRLNLDEYLRDYRPGEETPWVHVDLGVPINLERAYEAYWSEISRGGSYA